MKRVLTVEVEPVRHRVGHPLDHALCKVKRVEGLSMQDCQRIVCDLLLCPGLFKQQAEFNDTPSSIDRNENVAPAFQRLHDGLKELDLQRMPCQRLRGTYNQVRRPGQCRQCGRIEVALFSVVEVHSIEDFFCVLELLRLLLYLPDGPTDHVPSAVGSYHHPRTLAAERPWLLELQLSDSAERLIDVVKIKEREVLLCPLGLKRVVHEHLSHTPDRECHKYRCIKAQFSHSIRERPEVDQIRVRNKHRVYLGRHSTKWLHCLHIEVLIPTTVQKNPKIVQLQERTQRQSVALRPIQRREPHNRRHHPYVSL
mmetsp:Transcript_8221/g.24726  ORF Transcript_8221/g.24726 Transcript_8221/m.24726 type:complete len:311 (-) Transcript_8221:90-1022(-)